MGCWLSDQSRLRKGKEEQSRSRKGKEEQSRSRKGKEKVASLVWTPVKKSKPDFFRAPSAPQVSHVASPATNPRFEASGSTTFRASGTSRGGGSGSYSYSGNWGSRDGQGHRGGLRHRGGHGNRGGRGNRRLRTKGNGGRAKTSPRIENFPVGGRLALFRESWRFDPWAFSVVSNGLGWRWIRRPPPPRRFYQQPTPFLEDYVQELLENG